MDVLEFDAASEASVDDVRDKIVGATEYPPAYCRYKIFVIDEVHDLSPKAFDALLKTIEEPPSYMIFILATTEFQKVPPTIRSRCQKYEFHRGTIQDLIARLTFVAQAEQVEIEPAAIAAIARMADGGYRDALTLFEQAMVTADGAITLQQIYDQLGLIADESVDKMLVAMREKDVATLVTVLGETMRLGRDPRAVVESMMYRLADLTRSAYGVDGGVDGVVNASMHETSARIGSEAMLRFRSEIAVAHKSIRDVSLPRLWLEAELIRIAHGPALASPKDGAAKREAAPATQTPEPPARAAVEPAPARTEPKPEPKPAPAPTPKPTEAKIDANAPHHEQVWAKAVHAVNEVSKTLGAKLGSTRVASFENGKLIVAFDREIEKDTAVEGPKGADKRKAITDAVEKIAGERWTIEFVVLKKGSTLAEPAAVELPVEGERLVDLAKDVFPGA